MLQNRALRVWVLNNSVGGALETVYKIALYINTNAVSSGRC